MHDYDLTRKGWFETALQFADVIGHVSNYPYAYLYGMFLALSGHTIGRSAFIRYATPIYPNHFICLVGDSGIHHKSTAINLGLDVWGDMADEYQPIRSLTTSQGLLLAMSKQEGHTIVVLDELASMLSKKRQDFAADLMSRIVELYGCPRVAGNYTRNDPIEVKEPFLSFISASTTEWLRASVTNQDLMAGFGNRMTFILGDPRGDRPWPLLPSWEPFDWERLSSFKGEIRLDDDARALWNEDYLAFQAFQVKSSPFLRVMSERIPEKILKACIVICAWEGTDIVDAEILE
ncbi:hypothetical protein LCGC14_2379340, partial [marine sediment metagenome]